MRRRVAFPPFVFCVEPLVDAGFWPFGGIRRQRRSPHVNQLATVAHQVGFHSGSHPGFDGSRIHFPVSMGRVKGGHAR